MKIKSGKWLADWRDEKGVRHRKAFESKAQAHRFQNSQRREAAAKKAHASGPSGNSSRPGVAPAAASKSASSTGSSRRRSKRSRRTR